MQNYTHDNQLLYGLELAKLRYQKQDERNRQQKSLALSYQPQYFNQYEHPQSLFTRSSLESIPLAQPGMPVIPIPFTLMPWPVESQIQMGFDYQRSAIQQESRQQRIENIMNLGKPKPIQKPGDKIMYPRDNYGNTIFQNVGQSQLNQYYIPYPNQYGNHQQLQQSLQLNNQQQQQQINQKDQKKQQINKMLIQNQQKDNFDQNKFKTIDDKQLKESFKNSLHKSKLSDSLMKSSSHSSGLGIRNRLKKKLAVSTKKFRIFKASIIFISYYIKTLNSEIQKKLKICRERDKQIKDILEYMVGQYEEILELQLVDLLNNRLDYKLDIGKDSENKKKVEKIFAYLIKTLTESLKVKPESINTVIISFLKCLCVPGQFPPQEYFVQYEGERIRFNTIGQIGKISESVQMMIIEGFIILRVIVHQLLFKAWTYHPDQEQQNALFFVHRNALIIGSILCYMYHERYINEVKLKFDWSKVSFNKVELLPQITDDDEQDNNQGNNQVIVKNMLDKQVIQPYLKLMQLDIQKYGQLNDLITQICSNYLKEINKQIQIAEADKDPERPRMISLIMNTIFQEMYVSKRPRRQRSD